MAQHKNKDRKANVDAFKEQQKAKHAQASQPKTHIVPDVEYQSTEMLELRGDVADAIQKGLTTAFINLQKANKALQEVGQAYQFLLAHNINVGKAKLKYNWNNGQPATEAEIADFQAKMAKIQDERIKQQKEQEGNKEEPKTNLTTVEGRPLTEENLAEEKSGLIY